MRGRALVRAVGALGALLATLAAACGGDVAAPRAGAPPNLVLIVADDLGWSDLGCYGGEIRTPNLDRLADEGLRFTQFYNNGRCRPTRLSIETGLYPGAPGESLLTRRMVTLPRMLQAAGYQSTLSGKWHLGDRAPFRPRDCGYEEFFGLLDGLCNHFDPARPDPDFRGGGEHPFAHNEDRLREFPDDFYATDAITNHAVTNLRRMADAGRPFFLNVCYTAPHYPLQAPPEDIARYAGAYAGGWDELRERRHRRQLELGVIDAAWTLPAREPDVVAWGHAPARDWEADRMAVYAAMVDRLDQGVGRVLSALDELGLAERTLVLFLSDNGACAEVLGAQEPSELRGSEASYMSVGPGWANAQNTPFRRYKSYLHEGGIATPLIARWPGRIARGAITPEPGHVIDLAPTFLDLAGAAAPSGTRLEGRSLRPVLEGGTRDPPAALCWNLLGHGAVRSGRWKLVWEAGVDRWELYDLIADRTETTDLAGVQPGRTSELRELWWEWALRVGAESERPAGSAR